MFPTIFALRNFWAGSIRKHSAPSVASAGHHVRCDFAESDGARSPMYDRLARLSSQAWCGDALLAVRGVFKQRLHVAVV